MKCVDAKELSLKKVKINGKVIGKFGTFEVEQTFVNNKRNVLEVVYTFPLVDSSTVAGFEVEVGGNLLKGVSKEKYEAKKEYTENVVKGNSAYLMEQNDDNVFTINVGKLGKKEEVKIRIFFISKFEIIDNQIHVLIPTLVTPRYKSEMTKKLKYGKVGYTVDFNINIPSSLNCSHIHCPSHKTNIIYKKDSQVVEILDYDMSKDCKIYVGLKEELSSTALVSKTTDGNDLVYMSFMPEFEDKLEDSEKEYIFVIDVSGSMDWDDKIGATKDAVIKCLQQLDSGDKFNIVTFSHEFNAMSVESVEYDEETLKQAEDYVKDMQADGGTEMFDPIKFALYDDGLNKEYEKIVLLFTDGEVGRDEETDILNFVDECNLRFRIFPFGIDSNVNSEFIKELAKTGYGKAEFIMPDEKIDDKIIRQFARIQTPLLEDIKVDYGNVKLLDEIKEDSALFNYEFYNIFAKVVNIVNENMCDISLKGHIGDKEYSFKIDKVLESPVDLEKVFAKCLIDRHEEYIRKGIGDVEIHKDLIIELATKYNINSEYTSFVTVYERDEKLLDVPKVENTTLSNRFAESINWVGSCINPPRFAAFDDGESFYDYELCEEIIDYPDVHEATKNKSSELLKEDLTEILPTLSEEERNVLSIRYDFEGKGKYKTLDEVEKMLSINKERIKELENSALKKLRSPNRKKRLEEYLGKKISYRSLLGERMQMYYIKFMESENKSLTTYLLFAIICKTFDYQTLFDFLEQHKTEIQQSDLCMQLICKLYNILYYDKYDNGEKVDNLHILPGLLNQTYKKILLTNYNKNVDLEVLSAKEEEDVIEKDTLDENIDRAIWTLYSAPEYDECVVIPDFLKK